MSDVDSRFRAIAARYPRRRRRGSLAGVVELLERADVPMPPIRVAVVGTNGKSATATYLGRMLAGAGVDVALTTSPHLVDWSERLLVRESAVDGDVFVGEVERLHAVAESLPQREELRFFDLITLAASGLAVTNGCRVGIFEAGIGGRLDAVAALRPQLSVLTSVALDHTDLLGSTMKSILREKVAVAPRGSVLVAAADADLRPELERSAAQRGVELELLDVQVAPVLERSLALAATAYRRLVSLFSLDVPPDPPLVDARLAGRRQREWVGDVEVLLDGAHNPAAWHALLAELGGDAFVALVAAPADRDPASLGMLPSRGAVAAVVTEPWPGRSMPLEPLARELERSGLAVVRERDPQAALRSAVALAERGPRRVLAFGSFHLLTHLLPRSELIAAEGAKPAAAVHHE